EQLLPDLTSMEPALVGEARPMTERPSLAELLAVPGSSTPAIVTTSPLVVVSYKALADQIERLSGQSLNLVRQGLIADNHQRRGCTYRRRGRSWNSEKFCQAGSFRHRASLADEGWFHRG